MRISAGQLAWVIASALLLFTKVGHVGRKFLSQMGGWTLVLKEKL